MTSKRLRILLPDARPENFLRIAPSPPHGHASIALQNTSFHPIELLVSGIHYSCAP